jgi:four helix bundle protein
VAKSVKGSDRPARDQLLCASQSIPLHIAEGNGQGTNADRRRFFAVARGSALECASIQDGLEACEGLAIWSPGPAGLITMGFVPLPILLQPIEIP